MSGSGLAGEQGKIRTGSKTGLQLRRLPVRPERGQGQTLTRTLAILTGQDPVNPVRSGVSGPAVHVTHRSTHNNRKTSPPRATPHKAHTVALEKQLEGPRISRQGDPGSRVAPPPLKVLDGGKQCGHRSTITPSKPGSANFLQTHQKKGGVLT